MVRVLSLELFYPAWQAVEREGKGQNDCGRIGRRGVGNGLQGRYPLFSCDVIIFQNYKLAILLKF